MAWTEADLIKIETAIAKGWRRVRFADKEVEYQSNEQLFATRREIQNALAAQDRPRRRILRLFGSIS